MKIELSLAEIRALLQHLDFPTNIDRDTHAGISQNARNAWHALMAAPDGARELLLELAAELAGAA